MKSTFFNSAGTNPKIPLFWWHLYVILLSETISFLWNFQNLLIYYSVWSKFQLGTCTTGIEVFSIKNQILLKYTHKFKLPFNVFLWFILPPYANRWPFIYLIARCIFDIRINYYAISFFEYKMHGGAIILRFCIDKMTWVEQPNI